MTSEPSVCMIWDGYPAIERDEDDSGWVHIESARTDGKYSIAATLVGRTSLIPDSARARLTAWLVQQRLLGIKAPRITSEILDYAERGNPMRPDERARMLLRFVAQTIPSVGSRISVGPDDLGAFAWSESTNWEEVDYFINYLNSVGWLDAQRRGDGRFVGTVTIEGYEEIANADKNTVSTQAFVAMWFDRSMDSVYDNGIEPAIREAGYKPLKINLKPDVVKIDDDIIAGIRKSRFLVADFTQHLKEARGGVYFEAGFAMGLGIPVIFMCREDCVEYLHFDTRQYNHIVWENPEQLRVDLLNRIRARIGQGPLQADQGA